MKKVLIEGLNESQVEILMNFMASKLDDQDYISDIEIGGNDCNLDWIEDGMDISGEDMVHSLFELYGVEFDGESIEYNLKIDNVIFITYKYGEYWDDVYNIKK